MTGLVRKATLFGVCGLLAASAVLANVPDPTTSTVPTWLYATGIRGLGGPDAVGAQTGPRGLATAGNVITINDFNGQPISGIQVCIQLPCEFNLCNAAVTNPPWNQSVDCPNGRLCGTTDLNGQFKFFILAAGDVTFLTPTAPPGAVRPGGKISDTKIIVAGYAGTFKFANTIALDQNGLVKLPPTPGTSGNGQTTLDASLVQNQVGCYLAGGGSALPGGGTVGNGIALYRARADFNEDFALSGIDASICFVNSGRALNVGLNNGITCNPVSFCATKKACP